MNKLILKFRLRYILKPSKVLMQISLYINPIIISNRTRTYKSLRWNSYWNKQEKIPLHGGQAPPFSCCTCHPHPHPYHHSNVLPYIPHQLSSHSVHKNAGSHTLPTSTLGWLTCDRRTGEKKESADSHYSYPPCDWFSLPRCTRKYA
jgi:hypothetical protein